MTATVADLIAELQKIDGTLPVGCLVYGPERTIISPLMVNVVKMRHGCDELTESFSGKPHWFEIGTQQAQYHEERGGKLETVAAILPG